MSSTFTFCTSCGKEGIGSLAQCGCRLSDISLVCNKEDGQYADFELTELIIYRSLNGRPLHLAMKDKDGLLQSKLPLNCYPVPLSTECSYGHLSHLIDQFE